jgi:glutathione S-transferase
MVHFKLLGPASMRTFRCLWMLEELGLPYEHVSSAMPLSKQVQQYNPLGKVPVLLMVMMYPTKPNTTRNGDEDDDDDTAIPTTTTTTTDDTVVASIYESSAITTYLGDLQLLEEEVEATMTTTTRMTIPRPGTLERAWYDQTISVLCMELDAQGLWIHTKHERLGHLFTTIPAAVKHAQQYFHRTNRVLIQQLQRNKERMKEPQLQTEEAASHHQEDTTPDCSNDNSSSYYDCGYYLLGDTFSAADIIYVHCLEWSRDIEWHSKWWQDPVVLDYFKACTSRPAYRRANAIRQLENAERMNKKKNTAKKDNHEKNNNADGIVGRHGEKGNVPLNKSETPNTSTTTLTVTTTTTTRKIPIVRSKL